MTLKSYHGVYYEPLEKGDFCVVIGKVNVPVIIRKAQSDVQTYYFIRSVQAAWRVLYVRDHERRTS